MQPVVPAHPSDTPQPLSLDSDRRSGHPAHDAPRYNRTLRKAWHTPERSPTDWYLSHTNRLILLGGPGIGVYGAQAIAPDQSLLILPGGFLLGTAAVFLRARHFELNLREGMGTAFAMALLAYFLRVVLGAADDPA